MTPPSGPETLLTAQAAAPLLSQQLTLSVSPMTCYRRITKAAKQQDPEVRFVAGAWVAPLAWWQEEFRVHPPRRRGRPPQRHTHLPANQGRRNTHPSPRRRRGPRAQTNNDESQ